MEGVSIIVEWCRTRRDFIIDVYVGVRVLYFIYCIAHRFAIRPCHTVIVLSFLTIDAVLVMLLLLQPCYYYIIVLVFPMGRGERGGGRGEQ